MEVCRGRLCERGCVVQWQASFSGYSQCVPVPDVRCELNKVARADCKQPLLNSPQFPQPCGTVCGKQKNAGCAFAKQKGFNGLRRRPHARWNLGIALKSGIDKNDATVRVAPRRRSK